MHANKLESRLTGLGKSLGVVGVEYTEGVDQSDTVAQQHFAYLVVMHAQGSVSHSAVQVATS